MREGGVIHGVLCGRAVVDWSGAVTGTDLKPAEQCSGWLVNHPWLCQDVRDQLRAESG